MLYSELPKTIDSGAYRAGHCQGIAVDLRGGVIYYSFTTMLVKTALDGRFIGSVTGLCGHLGCIAFNRSDGRVYGSLEYKNDAIGRGILRMLGGGIEISDAFYIAVFDAERIVRGGMDASEVMRCAYLSEVAADYAAEFTGRNGERLRHRFGCSGIDGCAIGPDFGAPDGPESLFVAYGVYSDPSRTDNDHQVLLKYDIGELNAAAAVLCQDAMHRRGPQTARAKYFIRTGNTAYGVQNLEYDRASAKYYMAVYRGEKPEYPNPPMFAAPAAAAPRKAPLEGVWPETDGLLLSLDEHGQNGLDFAYGQTGLASLGDGYFYISHEARHGDMQRTTVRLYRMRGGAFVPA